MLWLFPPWSPRKLQLQLTVLAMLWLYWWKILEKMG